MLMLGDLGDAPVGRGGFSVHMTYKPPQAKVLPSCGLGSLGDG